MSETKGYRLRSYLDRLVNGRHSLGRQQFQLVPFGWGGRSRTAFLAFKLREGSMLVGRTARIFSFLVCLALIAPPPAWASRTVQCASQKYRYEYCRVDTDNRVELTRQPSSTRCRHGDNWGFDRRGVWVDRGCAAEFRVGSGGSGHAGAAAAAIAGVAIIAAIAAHNSKDTDVASWAVGTFRGDDEREGTDVELTILPGGSVSGRAGRHTFDGHITGDRLTAGNHVFRIARADNGFVGAEERDGYRVHFRRSGSGY